MIIRTMAPACPAAILAIAAGLTFAARPVQAIDPRCGVQGESGVSVGPAGRIAGDVAATEAGGRVRLGRSVQMGDGSVVLGDLVQLGPGTSVFNIAANTVKTSRNATIRGGESPVTLPVLDAACSISAIECGGPTVDVAKRRRQAIAPGRYGSVTVGAGATLALAAGRYEFCDLTVGRGGSLEALDGAATFIGVQGPLRAGVRAHIGPTDGGGMPAIDVGGRVRLSSKSRVEAWLSAPAAVLDVGPGSHLTGRFCSADVHLSRRVTLTCPAGEPATTTTSTSSSSTSTSVPGTSSTTVTSSTLASTLTSSTSTSSSMPPTSTTTSTSSTTSTTSTTATTSTSSTTSTTSVPSLCGNGAVDPGETCDDGNTSDNDTCPSDCVVDACTPVVGGTLVNAVLSFQSPGVPIAGFDILIDYPEGKLDYASAAPLVAGFFPPQDFGHALFVVRASATGIPSGPVLRTRYDACMGAPAATNGDFGCEVQLAVDAATNPVEGVTCSVTLE